MGATNPPRNPAALLGLGTDPALSRLLRACGADEACITGQASDHDGFLALAAALPLCEGHPLRAWVQATMQEATGLRAPLCPHTAHAYWDAWVQRHWYGREAPPAALSDRCPACAPASLRAVHAHECVLLPDPAAVQAPDLASWSRALMNALPEDGSPVTYILPPDHGFTRPDPYHAGLAVGKRAGGEELTLGERDLLVAQALRVWGLALAGAPVGAAPRLILRGGTPEAMIALLAYLEASKALPETLWIPDDPAQAGAVSGLYPQARTGYAVAAGEPAEAVEARKAAYARVAPIGRAILLAEGRSHAFAR